MGKKRKHQQPEKESIWCFYCDREFDSEEILVEHQRARHFKCSFCHKKLHSAAGLVTHTQNLHNEKITTVPNALKGRQSCELEIYGMSGIPDSMLDPAVAEKKKQEEAQKAAATAAQTAAAYHPPWGGPPLPQAQQPNFHAPPTMMMPPQQMPPPWGAPPNPFMPAPPPHWPGAPPPGFPGMPPMGNFMPNPNMMMPNPNMMMPNPGMGMPPNMMPMPRPPNIPSFVPPHAAPHTEDGVGVAVAGTANDTVLMAPPPEGCANPIDSSGGDGAPSPANVGPAAPEPAAPEPAPAVKQPGIDKDRFILMCESEELSMEELRAQLTKYN